MAKIFPKLDLNFCQLLNEPSKDCQRYFLQNWRSLAKSSYHGTFLNPSSVEGKYHDKWMAISVSAPVELPCDQKKLPNVHKKCPKMISLVKWYIMMPKNVGGLGKLIVAKGFKTCPMSNKWPNLVTLMAMSNYGILSTSSFPLLRLFSFY